MVPDASNLAARLQPYKGARVLVTGHTGFKGSWLVLWLQQLGAEVCGVALEPHTEPSLFALAVQTALARDERCDIREGEPLRRLVAGFEPDAVFHLAAQPLVRQSYDEAPDTFATNVMGSVHLFEAVQQTASVRALVHVSTDKCYENTGQAAGYRETDALGGHDPYSASKAAAEIAFASYQRSFFLPGGRVQAASGRAGNVVGGGDWALDRILPDSMRALSEGRRIPVRNPRAIRPWQHVLEALSGYLVLGARLLDGDAVAQGAWNFGPEEESSRTVAELADAVVAAWGAGGWDAAPDETAVHEAHLLLLACHKAREKLGWSPRWDFAETVRRTVNWYHAFYEGQPARELCRADIEAYMSDR